MSRSHISCDLTVSRINTLATSRNAAKLRMDMKMVPSGMLRRVALVRTDVSEVLSASFIKVTRIDELVTTLAATSNRRTLLGISSQRASVDSCS
jgi:thymidine phosphorylase